MTITFESDSNVIVNALEKIISLARQNQYLIVANCAWGIAGVIGLDSGLMTHIDNSESQIYLGKRTISATLHDIARLVSPELEFEGSTETLSSLTKKLSRKVHRKLAQSGVLEQPLHGGIRK
jgi:hypothetical protein